MADYANPTPSTNVTPISGDTQMTDEEKRAELRARIEAGNRRHQERTFADQAKDAADSAVEFAKKHPVATIAGGVVLGLAIGAMTRPGRRLGRRGGEMASYAADAVAAYALSMFDGASDLARTAGDKIEDFGDAAATSARGARRSARYRFDVAGDALRASGRKANRKSLRAARDLRRSIGY